MELYFCIAVVDRDKEATTAELFKAAGMREILTTFGRGTARSEHLAYYGLDATEKAIVCSISGASHAKAAFKQARRVLRIDIPGNGIMMTVPLKSVAGGRTFAYLMDNSNKGGIPEMKFDHELIIVVMNEGFSDFVMDAARSVGAGGGTVLHAKGTARGDEQRFFGLNIVDEKDMLYIVAYSDEKAAIMRAINEKAGPGTEAGAICFSLPISSVVGLRQRETE